MSRGHYAGYPMPDDRCPLVLSPKAPLYKSMNGATVGGDEDKEDAEFLATLDPAAKERLLAVFEAWTSGKIINHWFSKRRQIDVIVWQSPDGKSHSRKVQSGPGRRASMMVDTIGVSRNWDIEAEYKALEKLKGMVPDHIFDYYMLTGSFMETSKASGLIYIFRRCRPTIAMSTRKDPQSLTTLCALCLHTIGYYQGSFGGAMVPTDDVISHLSLMRGDERRYWAMCNQHDCWIPESGL